MLLPGLEQTIPGHGDIPALSSTPALTAELKLKGTVEIEISLQVWDKALHGKTSPVSSISLTEPGPAHYLCHGL